jgi:hypothetical protein
VNDKKINPQLIPLHPHKNMIKTKKRSKIMNMKTKFNRRAMIKGELSIIGIKMEATKDYTTTSKSVPCHSKISPGG